MRYLYLTLFFVVSFSCRGQKINTRKSNLKKFVLCQCIYNGVPEKSNLLKSDGSAAMYVQIGNYDIEYYEEAVEFVKNYLVKAENRYNSKTKANLTIAKCINLYESKELEEFIENFEKR